MRKKRNRRSIQMTKSGRPPGSINMKGKPVSEVIANANVDMKALAKLAGIPIATLQMLKQTSPALFLKYLDQHERNQRKQAFVIK